jgi:hypothetical protein
MTNQPDMKEIAKLLGRKGGEATSKKHGKDYFKRISRLGVEARRAKKEK